jgi:hypothetical protein
MVGDEGERVASDNLLAHVESAVDGTAFAPDYGDAVSAARAGLVRRRPDWLGECSRVPT